MENLRALVMGFELTGYQLKLAREEFKKLEEIQPKQSAEGLHRVRGFLVGKAVDLGYEGITDFANRATSDELWMRLPEWVQQYASQCELPREDIEQLKRKWQEHNRDNGMSWNEIAELINEVSQCQTPREMPSKEDVKNLLNLIEEALLSAKLKFIVEDDEANPLPLVDFLSVDGTTIDQGKEEIENLVEQIYFHLSDNWLKSKQPQSEWVSVEENPICYQAGDWDGLLSDVYLVELSDGSLQTARCYETKMDGSHRFDWYDVNDCSFGAETVIKYKKIYR